jgi:hypothetical protein
VGLFRRKQETLNEQLLREAGLDVTQMLGAAPPPPPAKEPVEPPQTGLARAGVVDGSAVGPKDWDATCTITAPALMGDRVQFATLPNGDLIISEENGDADLTPLAEAVEHHLRPPYRAVGRRQDGNLWGVGAKRIQVAKIPFSIGEKLEFSRHVEHAELRVDGEESNAFVPAELERLGEALGDSFYVEAERIDGDLWEVRATAL